MVGVWIGIVRPGIKPINEPIKPPVVIEYKVDTVRRIAEILECATFSVVFESFWADDLAIDSCSVN
jgi:hypothetical protein